LVQDDRGAVLGPAEFWLPASDPLTATTTIITVSIHASSTRADEDEYGPERPHRENQPNLAITDLGQADAIAGENHER
jgi:hypothetical protein